MSRPTSLEMQPIAILGIPVTNETLFEMVLECLKRIQENKSTGCSYHCTVSPTMIATCYGYFPSSVARPEILSTIRHADLSSSSGSFLKQLASLLGSVTAPSYTTPDLILSLCRALGDKKMGVFLLGKDEKKTKSEAIAIHDKCNQIRLVGIASPPIFIKGEELIHSQERDALLIEQINASRADVLFVNLGEVAQELWLERTRRHLTVPLIILVGDSLDYFEKTPPLITMKGHDQEVALPLPKAKSPKVEASPSFLQQLKLVWMAIPLILYHTASRLRHHYFAPQKKSKAVSEASLLFLSAHHSIPLIALPRFIGPANVPTLMQKFEDSANHDTLIMDFQNVWHIQPEGFYFIMQTWLKFKEKNKGIYALGVTAWVQNLMKFHRSWDLFKNSVCHSAEDLLSRVQAEGRTTFYDSFSQTENLVTVSLLGVLDHKVDLEDYMKKLIPIIDSRNCCLNFNYCSFIDNSGFAFLLNLRKHLRGQQHTLTFTSISPSLQKQFKEASVDFE